MELTVIVMDKGGQVLRMLTIQNAEDFYRQNLKELAQDVVDAIKTDSTIEVKEK